MSHCEEIGLLKKSIMKKTDNQEISLSNNLIDLYQESEETSTKKVDNPIIETITETTNKDYVSDEKISSVPDSFVKTDFMKKALLEGIEKNKQGKTKLKKPKEPTDELTAEIHIQAQAAHDFLADWYKSKYATPYLTSTKEFVNLKATFKKLISADGSFTPERCFKGVQYILNNFDKLDDFDRKKISLNYIATNWSALIKNIQDYKAPIPKQNYNEPVAPVHTKLPEFYNGYALPMGISTMQFEKLGELVYRDKIMDGLIDESFMSVYEFLEKYRGELKKITTEQLNQLMKDYEIV
jgi:hypothetical protein